MIIMRKHPKSGSPDSAQLQFEFNLDPRLLTDGEFDRMIPNITGFIKTELHTARQQAGLAVSP